MRYVFEVCTIEHFALHDKKPTMFQSLAPSSAYACEISNPGVLRACLVRCVGAVSAGQAGSIVPFPWVCSPVITSLTVVVHLESSTQLCAGSMASHHMWHIVPVPLLAM